MKKTKLNKLGDTLDVLRNEFEEVIEDLKTGFYYQELSSQEIDEASIKLKQISSIKRQLNYSFEDRGVNK